MKKLLGVKLGKTHPDWNTSLALACLPGMLLVFVLQKVFLYLNIYTWYFNQLDVFMHLIGGASVAWAVWAIMSYARSIKKLPPLPFWFAVMFAVGMALTVGVFWEFYEFLSDQLLHTDHQLVQFGVADTMKDLADDLIGALLLSVLVGRKMLKNN